MKAKSEMSKTLVAPAIGKWDESSTAVSSNFRSQECAEDTSSDFSAIRYLRLVKRSPAIN